MTTAPSRCPWCGIDPLYVHYHDTEWGVPLRAENTPDVDTRWFERLTLEGAQAGLSWITILRKREHYRRAFDQFDVGHIAHYDDAKIAALLADAGIVRNRLKINATVRNARCFLEIQAAFGSFDAYIWRFVDGQPQRNTPHTMADVPAETATSRAISKDLQARGMTFVGPTICYAMMQATGMVNDHLLTCFRHHEL
jgi:DNA-3-methyladenine glycosylase I